MNGGGGGTKALYFLCDGGVSSMPYVSRSEAVVGDEGTENTSSASCNNKVSNPVMKPDSSLNSSMYASYDAKMGFFFRCFAGACDASIFAASWVIRNPSTDHKSQHTITRSSNFIVLETKTLWNACAEKLLSFLNDNKNVKSKKSVS